MMIGIDISKDTFDTASSNDGKSYTMGHFANTEAGHKKFMKHVLPKGQDQVIMEATGPYWYRLALTLAKADITVSVVNPLQIKRFGQMHLRRSKTDPADARLICLYGITVKPAPFTAPEGFLLLAKQLVALDEQLGQAKVMFGNQHHAFKAMPDVDPVVEETLNELRTFLKAKIKQVEERIDQLLQEHCPVSYQVLQTIPAIGKKAAAVLIVLTGNFHLFPSAKHLSSFAGLCPHLYQSGTSLALVGHISKRGSPRLRRLLYLCAVAATRWNKACALYYQMLRDKGKPGKVAMVAVANKLLRQCYSVATAGKPFQEILPAPTCI